MEVERVCCLRVVQPTLVVSMQAHMQHIAHFIHRGASAWSKIVSSDDGIGITSIPPIVCCCARLGRLL